MRSQEYFPPLSNLAEISIALKLQGWAALDNDSRRISTLEIADLIGTPMQSPTGDYVRRLMPKSPTDSAAGTFSGTYGKADFPLHTDTAFWSLPARYLVMRVTGDTRRPTIIVPIAQIYISSVSHKIDSSVWIVKCDIPFYCSMKFQMNGITGFRYDPLIMQPASKSAKYLYPLLPKLFNKYSIVHIDWNITGTVIIDNWRSLHGRGPEPTGEMERLLERVYVEKL